MVTELLLQVGGTELMEWHKMPLAPRISLLRDAQLARPLATLFIQAAAWYCCCCCCRCHSMLTDSFYAQVDDELLPVPWQCHKVRARQVGSFETANNERTH
jgi:hypothetical protein